MNKTILIGLMAASCHLSASADTQNSFEEIKTSQAYELMSAEYTTFAKLFNVCQKKPSLPDCGETYEKARSKYELAKHNYEAMKMSQLDAFSELEAPSISYPSLAINLESLGYLELGDKEEVLTSDLMVAINKWQEDSGVTKTSHISMFTMQAIGVDAMSLSE
ncbi:hypothetical protein [Vibrio crassostreae]|uniref:hypothetical protein n=1 Tax=Vibrio crassostreae TaxID=246167 RepID=UPI001B304E67|nr:hypothetical protein [Vibrio crassostreae]